MGQNDKEGELHDKKVLANFMIIMIVLTIIFMMVVSWTHIKINNDVACGRDDASLYRHALGIQNSTILDEANESVIMLAPFNKTDIVEDYQFCIRAVVQGDSLHTYVINENHTKLAYIYLDNSTTKFCAYIEEDQIEENMYIGIICEDCNATQNITLKESILGSRQRVEGNNAGITISSDKPLAYELYWYDSCRPSLKWWMGMYVIVISVLIFVALLWIGLSRLSSWILNVDK